MSLWVSRKYSTDEADDIVSPAVETCELLGGPVPFLFASREAYGVSMFMKWPSLDRV